MKVSDIKNVSDLIIYVSAMIRKIIIYPFRLIAFMLLIPNVKIVYHSGHVEYYFFRNIKIQRSEDDKLETITWSVVTPKSPFYINIAKIESIHSIY